MLGLCPDQIIASKERVQGRCPALSEYFVVVDFGRKPDSYKKR